MLSQNPPVLTVEAWQDKNRMAHYVPLHPALLEPLTALRQNHENKEMMFDIFSLQMWLKNHHAMPVKCQGHLVLRD